VRLRYDEIDQWAHVSSDFPARINRKIAESIAISLITIGVNGKKRVRDSDFASNPLLQDVAKGWLQKMREESFQAAKQSGKMDRVALGIKNEEITKQQAEEMSKVLSPEQMEIFNKFVDENSRKRPRYNDELLAKIQKEAQLSDEQMKVVNAANDAFEKSFNDAHDVYHGNNDLAKEYWEKFDTQRKAVIKKTLSPEQYTKFEEVVKEVNFKPRKK